MAKIINPSKLLPSSKSTAIVKVGKPNVIAKTSTLSKGLLAKRETKDSTEANNKLVKIDKFLKSDLIVSQKKAEVKRKKKETQDFDEAEKKLETPQSKKFKLPGFNLPSLGFMDRVKRFLFFTALGWLVPKIIEFLPKLEGFAKIVGGIYQFAEGMFGKLFDGFMSLVKFGGDLKDKTLGFIASAKAGVGGNYQKEFDKLEKQFNTFVNASIIAGVLAADIGSAAVDEINKQRKKGQKPAAGKPAAKAGAKVTQGRGGKKPSGKPKVTTGKGGKVPGWWNNLFKGPFAKLKGPLSKFAGAAVPGLGAVVGAADAAARFKAGDNIGGALASVSAGLDTITTVLALTGVGLPAAAIFGAVSIGIDVILLIRDIAKAFFPFIPMFSRGGRVVKRYQGGGTTRGGRPVGGPKRRAITPTRRKPPRVTLPKTQPGKDVGGEKKVKEFYAKPEDPSKRYTRPAGGWLANLGKERQDLSAFDTLKKMSGTLKSDETLAKGILGVMSSGIDMALGQKPDKKVFKAFFDSIGYIADTLANQRTSKSMSSLRSQIGAFAEGGTVPSRGLRGTYSDANTGDMLAKLIGPTIDQRVNEAIQSIEKQLQMKGAAGPGAGAGPDAGGAGGTAGGEYGGYAPRSGLEREIYEYLTKEKKLNDVQALGLLANINRESSFRPGVQITDINGKPSGGLFQWNGGRFTSMVSRVPDWKTNWKGQVDWALDEPWIQGRNGKAYIAKSFSSAQEAADWWMNEWEVVRYPDRDSKKHAEYLKTVPKAPDGTAKFREGTSGAGAEAQVTGGIKPSQIPLISGQGPRWGRMHNGIDLDGGDGSPISSAQNAEVVFAGDNGDNYGNTVVLRYSNGAETRFAHLKSINVRTGQKIKAGQLLGKQGSTGRSTASHLHFEYFPSGGAMSYKGHGDAYSVKDSYFRYGGNVQAKVAEKPLDSPPKPGQPPRQQQAQRPQPQPTQQSNWLNNLNPLNWFNKPQPQTPSRRTGIINYKGQIYYEQGGKYYEIPSPGSTPIEIDKRIYDMVPRTGTGGGIPDAYMGGNMQGGGLIGPPKSRLPLSNSFASYETPRGGMMIAIQPIIIEKQVPVSSGNKMIAFPVPVAVNSSIDLSLSRG